MNTVSIGNREVGNGKPCFIIAEIGINHNGDINIAKKLIDVAAEIGCDAVKFQKRTPDLCVPEDQKMVYRETPWGIIPYIEYRRKVEFGKAEYSQIDAYCKEKNILWFASCWDVPSVKFMMQYKPCCFKIASASLTDNELLEELKSTGLPLILSTGMSTEKEIAHAVKLLGTEKLILGQATSVYPCLPEEVNLQVINTLRKQYACPVGYSGHEAGLQISLAAVAIGADFVERHITLDRAMWGSDHAASLEPQGLRKLVRDIRIIEKAIGNGKKVVYESEMASRKKLRGN